MKIKQLLEDYNIAYTTEGSNTQEGWININCPFCSDPSAHGGFNLAGSYYNCWKCGWHPLENVLSELLGTSKTQQVIEQYQGCSDYRHNKKIALAKKIKYPTGTDEIQVQHKLYLKKRNFDPDEIKRLWDIKGTGHIGEYSFRIIMPIYYRNRLVSYQSRDITDKQKLRYKACRIEKEVIHHKHLLYGFDKVKDKMGILVEGVTDVWRLGAGAVAAFGTSYTPEQVSFIHKNFNVLFILFDTEKDAQDKAKKLSLTLAGLGLRVEIIKLDEGDPADLGQEEANNIKKELLGYV